MARTYRNIEHVNVPIGKKLWRAIKTSTRKIAPVKLRAIPASEDVDGNNVFKEAKGKRDWSF